MRAAASGWCCIQCRPTGSRYIDITSDFSTCICAHAFCPSQCMRAATSAYTLFYEYFEGVHLLLFKTRYDAGYNTLHCRPA